MQSALVNIPSSIDDPNYRYKMPKMILKIEGKGNGIKTNIVNMADVAKALRVPTDYPLKFMGIELGSQIQYKKSGNDITTVMNGAFTDDQLIKYLDKFIEKYVICQNCTYPELVLRIRKGVVCAKCDSCGARPQMDNVHKLATYIIKNPPSSKGIEDGDKEKDGKEKTEKTEKGKKDKDGKDKKKDDKGEKGEKDKKKKTEKGEEDEVKLLGPNELKLGSQLLNDKVKVLREAFKDLSVEEDDKIAFKDFENTVSEFVNEIKTFNLQAKMDDRIAYLLFNSIFSVNIAHEVPFTAKLLSALAERFGLRKFEQELILNLQHFLFDKHKDQDFSKFVPTILMKLYDADLLSEETVLEWDAGKFNFSNHFLYNEENNKKLLESGKPFFEWLKQAGEEEDGEEEK